jgi:uncharacterized protein (TIGR03000 family)
LGKKEYEMKKMIGMGAIACLVAVSLTAGPAHAQRWRLFGTRGGTSNYYPSDYYGGYSVGPAYYTPYAASNYGWGPVVGTGIGQYSYGDNLNTRNRNTYQSMYSPATSVDDARIRVWVPDTNAQVFFDDSPTRQNGMERFYNSPPLDPSKTYSYTIRATWTENGKEVSRTKDVKVQSGRTAVVDFRATSDNTDSNIPTPREDKSDLKSPGTDTNKESKSLPPGSPSDKSRSDNPRNPDQ